MINNVAPEHFIVEAYERMIGLILNDSPLVGMDIIEINIFVEQNCIKNFTSEHLRFKFRRTGISYSMVGVHKIN